MSRVFLSHKWDYFTGVTTIGPLPGAQLAQVPITYAYWFGWADYYPDGTVYSPP